MQYKSNIEEFKRWYQMLPIVDNLRLNDRNMIWVICDHDPNTFMVVDTELIPQGLKPVVECKVEHEYCHCRNFE